jgi:hypothetical protein
MSTGFGRFFFGLGTSLESAAEAPRLFGDSSFPELSRPLKEKENGLQPYNNYQMN